MFHILFRMETGFQHARTFLIMDFQLKLKIIFGIGDLLNQKKMLHPMRLEQAMSLPENLE